MLLSNNYLHLKIRISILANMLLALSLLSANTKYILALVCKLNESIKKITNCTSHKTRDGTKTVSASIVNLNYKTKMRTTIWYSKPIRPSCNCANRCRLIKICYLVCIISHNTTKKFKNLGVLL